MLLACLQAASVCIHVCNAFRIVWPLQLLTTHVMATNSGKVAVIFELRVSMIAVTVKDNDEANDNVLIYR